MVSAMSSVVAPYSIARTASAASSETYGPAMWMPRILPVFACAIILMLPTGCSSAFARPLAADGDDELVELLTLLLPFRLVLDRDRILASLARQHLRAEPDVEPLLGELAQRILGDLLIDHRQERRQRFEDDGLGAEPGPNA